MKINYASGKTPQEYVCGNCGASGVKLWREYQTVCPPLLCAKCAASEQDRDISTLDGDGCRASDLGRRPRTDQIGWRVPAVPDEEGVGYWGYTSVPEAGVNWWRELPNEMP
jgi:hypothetical protein